MPLLYFYEKDWEQKTSFFEKDNVDKQRWVIFDIERCKDINFNTERFSEYIKKILSKVD